MEPNRFESMYPENSRFDEIEKIFKFIKEGNSMQMISIPGVGRSNLLGLLSYNRRVRIRHLGEKEQVKYHFVLLNFSEMRKRPLMDVTKFLFLALADSLKERKILKDYEKIDAIFKDAIATGDELVIFQGLKKTIDFLALEKELTVVFLFDRFEEYVGDVSSDFFRNLRVLRNRAKYRFSVIFSLNRPLVDSVGEEMLSDFYELLEENEVYLPIEDVEGLNFRINYLEKSTGEKIPDEIKSETIKLSGGHGKLVRVSLEAYLSYKPGGNIKEFLLSRNRVNSVLNEIWRSFTPQEQEILKNIKNTTDVPKYFIDVGIIKDNLITIPLFADFVVAKGEENTGKIIFDPEKNEIRKGELVHSNNLTSLEFKLLKFLIENADHIISRDEIVGAVWGEQKSTAGVTEQALDQLIFRIRKKIETNPNSPIHIETIKGRGFKFSS